jgi:hypothetical protein
MQTLSGRLRQDFFAGNSFRGEIYPKGRLKWYTDLVENIALLAQNYTLLTALFKGAFL